LKGMQEELECPVCFEIPRELPIPACPKGHIVCKNCRKNVQTCPTCRADFCPDGVNIPVGAMIHKIPHKCKFSRYGCDVQRKLEDLVKHEKRCPERTVRCPEDACGQEVQIKNCGIEHFKSHFLGGWMFRDPDSIPYVYQMIVNCAWGDIDTSYLNNWDGISKNRGEEFNLNEDIDKTNPFNQLGKTFFVKTKYVAARRCFLLIVLMADLPEVAAQYMVHCKISNGDGSFEIDYKCPVISIEELPKRGAELQMFLEARSWNISYHNMKNLFRFADWNRGRGKIGNMKWVVAFRPEVKIFKK